MELIGIVLAEPVNLNVYSYSGVIGLMALAIIALWKSNNSKDEIIKQQAEKMTEVATTLSHTQDSMSGAIKDLPDNIKAKVVPPIMEELKDLQIKLKTG